MILALSMLSSQAMMGFWTQDGKKKLALTTWDNLSGTDLAEFVDQSFLELKAKVPSEAITRLMCVQGPGSFTGLRVSSAFMKGIGTALNIPLIGIPSFQLFGEAFAFSLRPAKAATLNLEECFQKEFKFLEVTSDSAFRIVEKPECKKILGLKDQPLWPRQEELERGILACLESRSFELNYGYTPEFVLAK